MAQNLKIIVLIVSLFIWITGCGTIETRRSLEKKSGESSSTFGEGGQEDEDSQEMETSEEPVKRPPKLPKVGVILGPGMAKTMAHGGALKSLVDAKIPIDAVVGMGWGALPGALYAKEGKIHGVQWQLMKLRKSDLPGKSFFSGKAEATDVSSLKGFLRKVLGAERSEKSTVPFYCPTQSLKTGGVIWQRVGPTIDLVSKCLAFPPLYKPYKKRLVGEMFSVDMAAKYLRRKGMDVIIFINVMDKGSLLSEAFNDENASISVLWNQIRKTSMAKHASVDHSISVSTRAFGLMDFNKQKALIQAGEKAMDSAADAIVQKYDF